MKLYTPFTDPASCRFVAVCEHSVFGSECWWWAAGQVTKRMEEEWRFWVGFRFSQYSWLVGTHSIGSRLAAIDKLQEIVALCVSLLLSFNRVPSRINNSPFKY